MKQLAFFCNDGSGEDELYFWIEYVCSKKIKNKTVYQFRYIDSLCESKSGYEIFEVIEGNKDKFRIKDVIDIKHQLGTWVMEAYTKDTVYTLQIIGRPKYDD